MIYNPTASQIRKALRVKGTFVYGTVVVCTHDSSYMQLVKDDVLKLVKDMESNGVEFDTWSIDDENDVYIN